MALATPVTINISNCMEGMEIKISALSRAKGIAEGILRRNQCKEESHKIDMKLSDGSKIHVASQPMGKERFKALCGLAVYRAGYRLELVLIKKPRGFLSRGTFQGMGKIRQEKSRRRLKAVFGGG